MPGPIAMVAAPLVLAGIVFLLNRWRIPAVIFSIVSLLILWIIVFAISPGDSHGLITGEAWLLLGRSLVLTDSIRTAMLVIYGGTVILILLTLVAPQSLIFIPLCLALLSPIAGSLMVRPFVFGAVLLLITAAGVALMIQDERVGSTQASWRYLAIFALAPPLLLIGGWMLETGQQQFIPTTVALLSLACIILLIGFPFHIWVAPTSDEARSLVLVAAAGLVQLAVIIFLTNLIRSNMLILLNPQFALFMRVAGVVTVIAGALLALIAPSLGRLVGYLLLLDVGITLSSLGLGTRSGLNLAILTVILRTVSIILVAIGLNEVRIRPTEENQIPVSLDGTKSSLKGIAYAKPFAVILLSYGALSLVGLPLTPGFPSRWAFIVQASQHSMMATVIVILSMAIGVFGILRWVLQFVNPGQNESSNRTSFFTGASLLSGVILFLALFLALYPRWSDGILNGISVP